MIVVMSTEYPRQRSEILLNKISNIHRDAMDELQEHYITKRCPHTNEFKGSPHIKAKLSKNALHEISLLNLKQKQEFSKRSTRPPSRPVVVTRDQLKEMQRDQLSFETS
jgi:hypothetical protein